MSSNTASSALTNISQQVKESFNSATVPALAATALASSVAAALTVATYYRLSNAGRNGTTSATEQQAIYSTQDSAKQYMEFHYTPGSETFVRELRYIQQAFDFPVRVAKKFRHYMPNRKTPSEAFGGSGATIPAADSDNSLNTSPTRAAINKAKKNFRGLDLGCATGASSFEMSKYFDGGVVGIDFSSAFIDLANELKEKGEMEYFAPDQGLITTPRKTSIPAGTFPDRCEFFVGDAMNLLPGSEASLKASGIPNPESFHVLPNGSPKFDGVLAANLLCRVPDPKKLLLSFSEMLNHGGVLVLVSPYSWWPGASAVDKWIGGRPNGPRSEEAVKEILSKDFELLEENDEPFLIRDHSRRYQLGFSHCTVWRRK